MGLLPFTSRSWREQTILISQSPIALPEETSGSSIQEVFHGIAQKWANKHELGDVDVVWAVSGIQFGWNRHGKSGAAAHGRTPAVRVILPGAVIRLKNIINPILLSNALIAGVGEMRERGFGALLPHPGKADSLYRNNPTPPELKSDERVKEGVIKAFSFFPDQFIQFIPQPGFRPAGASENGKRRSQNLLGKPEETRLQRMGTMGRRVYNASKYNQRRFGKS